MPTNTPQPPPPDAVWLDLSDAQADGLACVVCGRDYLVRFPGRRLVTCPVGRSHTGSQVMACEPECHDIATALIASATAATSHTDPSSSVSVTAGHRPEVRA